MAEALPPISRKARILWTVVFVAAGAALMGVLATLHVPWASRLWFRIYDAGHAVIFGLLALVFLGLLQLWLPRARVPFRHYLIAFLASGFVGIVVEIVQFYGPRDADREDLFRNFLGAAAFLAFFARPFGPRPRLSRFLAAMAALALLLVAFFPVISLTAAYAHREAVFPRIGDFDSRFERPLVKGAGSRVEWIEAPPGGPGSAGAVRVTFLEGSYPFLAVRDLHRDWTGYTHLAFEVFWEGDEDLTIYLRIHDVDHNEDYLDRFNTTLALKPGWNRYRIPLSEVESGPAGRRMNMQGLSAMLFFADHPREPLPIVIDAIRLEGDP